MQAQLARRHGISTSQLWDWRASYKAGLLESRAEFSQVVVTQEGSVNLIQPAQICWPSEFVRRLALQLRRSKSGWLGHAFCETHLMAFRDVGGGTDWRSGRGWRGNIVTASEI